MLEGRPRESLVLYDTPIEVRALHFVAESSYFLLFCRLDLCPTKMIPSRDQLEVSRMIDESYVGNVKLTFM